MFKTIRKWLQSEHRYIDLSTDPRAARHWHNPADPVQAARIEAAAAKRSRKVQKLQYNTAQSIRFNIAHIRPCDGFRHPNPFYIAK